MSKKRYIFGILALVLGLAATGCGAETLLEKTEEQLTEKVEQAGDIGKEKFKEAAKKGYATAKDIGNEAIKEALNDAAENKIKEQSSQTGLLSSSEDIQLTNTDGDGKNYTFIYDGETFDAVYIPDHWKVVDSYKIDSEADMMIICQALIDEHQVHGRDMVSYRTAEDMVYEWEIHNLAYVFIGDDERLKNKAKDVDFDPEDQGRNFEEIYYDRTGKELDIGDFLGN